MPRRQEPRAAQATSVWLWRKDSNLNLSVNSRAHRPAMLRQNKTGAEGEIYLAHPCASGLRPSARLFKFVPDEFVNSQQSGSQICLEQIWTTAGWAKPEAQGCVESKHDASANWATSAYSSCKIVWGDLWNSNPYLLKSQSRAFAN